MSNKPSTPEEEYFAREEVLKRYKLAQEQASKRQKEEADALRAAHFMKCPKCGNDLSTITFREVEIDNCFSCGGSWLDAGELEKLAGKENDHGILKAVVNVFRRSEES